MIILHTNVLSEIMRPAPEARVVGWLALRPSTSLFTATLTQAKVLDGARLATRNVADFGDCGIELLDPWTL